MSLALIYARSENYCIGRNGALPWRLPDEFDHFITTTTGAATIMGRKTYDDHSCVLPGRLNIVVTRQKHYPLAPGVHRACSLQSALEFANRQCSQVFVIGGSNCLRDALPLADTVYETEVHADLSGDTFVDAFDFRYWNTELLEHHPMDEQHRYAFSIYKHRRPHDTVHLT